MIANQLLPFLTCLQNGNLLAGCAQYKAELIHTHQHINKLISAMAVQYNVSDDIPREFNDLKYNKNDNLYMVVELKKTEKGE